MDIVGGCGEEVGIRERRNIIVRLTPNHSESWDESFRRKTMAKRLELPITFENNDTKLAQKEDIHISLFPDRTFLRVRNVESLFWPTSCL